MAEITKSASSVEHAGLIELQASTFQELVNRYTPLCAIFEARSIDADGETVETRSLGWLAQYDFSKDDTGQPKEQPWQVFSESDVDLLFRAVAHAGLGVSILGTSHDEHTGRVFERLIEIQPTWQETKKGAVSALSVEGDEPRYGLRVMYLDSFDTPEGSDDRPMIPTIRPEADTTDLIRARRLLCAPLGKRFKFGEINYVSIDPEFHQPYVLGSLAVAVHNSWDLGVPGPTPEEQQINTIKDMQGHLDRAVWLDRRTTGQPATERIAELFGYYLSTERESRRWIVGRFLNRHHDVDDDLGELTPEN